MLRMNTPASCACACMRTRSPRIAPPVYGLVGSTASTPTFSAHRGSMNSMVNSWPAWFSGLHRPQQLPRDHQPLHFARAFANRAQLDVAEIFLGRIVLDEAVAAMNLDALLGDAHGDLAR